MPYHPCVSGCDQDGHNCCLTCLGIQHAEEAFVNGSCTSYGDMTISELHNRLRNVKHGQSGIPHLSSTPQPAGMDRAGTSAEQGTPPVSFGAPPDDRMSIVASEGELSLSALPPSGVVALSEPDPKMLSRAAEHVGLVWNPPLHPDSSRLDEWFLCGGHTGSQRPPPCHSPGSAWGAYKIVEGTFHCPKQISELLPPHHPRWWSRFGVHGHPLCGAVCSHATVSNSRYHSAGWSVSPSRAWVCLLLFCFVLVRTNWQCL